ncbi:hypothetical protein RYH80_08860 [Halobaculum sp. MBLA0147]|uniref:hypothetical protein n=1 Tax=Halobaculum sp. MBLA0147 TaxID=3079934 RepID=UPI003526610C
MAPSHPTRALSLALLATLAAVVAPATALGTPPADQRVTDATPDAPAGGVDTTPRPAAAPDGDSATSTESVATHRRSAASARSCPIRPHGDDTGNVSTTTDERSERANTDGPPIPDERRDTTVPRGDLAVVPLSVPAGANATVSVVGENYTARSRVVDDGDGRVRLVVNTYLAGGGIEPDETDDGDGETGDGTASDGTGTGVRADAYAVAGRDRLVVVGGNGSGAFDAGNYTVVVRSDGERVDSNRLTVTPAAVENVTLRRGVPRLFGANATELRAASARGLVSNRSAPDDYARGDRLFYVTRGETLLVRFEAPSLLGVVAAQSGANVTERVLALHEWRDRATPATFRLSGPCGGIDPTESARQDSLRAVVDHRTGVVTLLLDTERLAGYDVGSQTASLGASGWLDTDATDRERFDAPFRFTSRGVRLDDVRVEHGGSLGRRTDVVATVQGRVNLLPGSRVNVTLSSRVDSGVDRVETVTVRPGETSATGCVTAAVGVSGVSRPNAYVVHVAGRQTTVAVGDVPSVWWNIDVFGHERPDRNVTVSYTQIDRYGRSIGVYAVDPTTRTYELVGVLSTTDDVVELPPDSSPRYLFVVAHRDTDDDLRFDGPFRDRPVTVGGSAAPRYVNGTTERNVTVFGDWVASTTSGLATPNTSLPPFGPETVSTGDVTVARETATETPPTAAENDTPTGTATGITSQPATPSASETVGPDPRDTRTETPIPGVGPITAVIALVVALLVGGRRARG